MVPKDFKVIFMGTPEFAVESLKTIHSHFNIVAVVTAPDKPRGRGQELSPTPVKKFAIANNLPVLQPANLKSPDFIEALQLLEPDLAVVVAFRMLPKIVWALPKLGSINLHASILPQYRGAAPINHAIINGETATGVTTFFLQDEIDTGDIIKSKIVSITPEDNAGTLHDKLMTTGAEVLLETLQMTVSKNYLLSKQSEISVECLNPAPKISKEFCRINWKQKGKHIHNFIRGLSPYPGAYTETTINNKSTFVKIYKGYFEEGQHKYPCGSVIHGKYKLKTAVTDGWYIVLEIQQSGKKRMAISDFLNGLNGEIITEFGHL